MSKYVSDPNTIKKIKKKTDKKSKQPSKTGGIDINNYNKETLHALLRSDFKSFVIKIFNEVSGGAQYKDNWHVDLICHELMNMLEGKNNRLIINIPPRYLKSIICSVALPAFLLGHHPDASIICVSYSNDLSSKFANDCRNVILSFWYKELFSGTSLSQSKKATDDFETTKGGGRFATSIGGTITGRGADWIIIDDPLKPADAMSDNQREKVNEWYGSTLYSRLNNKDTDKIILIMQRLHENDLTGFLIDSEHSFKHLKLPVIAEEDEEWLIKNRVTGKEKTIRRKKDELLHHEREDWDVITDLQRSLGTFAFAGQYQQNPAPVEGAVSIFYCIRYVFIVNK